MAYNRVIMITCSMFQSSQYHQSIAARWLTAQQGSYGNICHIYCVVCDIAWNTQSVITLVLESNTWLTPIKLSCWVKFNGQDLTHPYIWVYSLDRKEIIAKYLLHLLMWWISWLLCAVGQKNWTQCIWDIRRTLTLIVRDELLSQHQFLASIHTQNKEFQYSVSVRYWSQHNSPTML
jgi:hypothetical protein